jgi:transcriptional regulator with XRE-family HTH domain
MKHFDPLPLGYFKINWLVFGRMVLAMREANGMTLREASALLDISPSTIMRAEHGFSVEPDHFFTLLQFVGVPFDLPDKILLEVGTPVGT